MASDRGSEKPIASSLLDRLVFDGYEQVVFCHDRWTGLRSIIAIHDTTLGPALGGVRMWPYGSEEEALDDCLRLAKGMTYKAAAAGVNLGGGKSVIIGDPDVDKTELLLRAHGRFIQSLGGRYIPGIDVGTDQQDLRVIGLEATRVSCAAGDPSPMTALGVEAGMRVCLEEVFGSADIARRRIAIQGAGHVGGALAIRLAKDGAEIVIADVDHDRSMRVAEEVGGRAVDPEEITGIPCDVFAPCAMGAAIDDHALSVLDCRIVAGSANNVLASPRHGEALAAAGVLYAPDYVVNAGGLIFLEEEMLGHDAERTTRRVEGVGDLLRTVFKRGKDDRVSPMVAADRIAQERLESTRQVGPAFVSSG